jgi:hypothetical protein
MSGGRLAPAFFWLYWSQNGNLLGLFEMNLPVKFEEVVGYLLNF